MKTTLILGISLMVAGCSTVLPAKPKFPAALPELTEACPSLEKINADQVAITELLETVTRNYDLYYKCSLKNEGWNRWYKEQKENYEKTK